MDKLAKDAKNALKKGMSYGQYMAQKKPEIIIPQKPKEQMRECLGCGNPFPLNTRGKGVKKFCSDECREKFYDDRKSQQRWEQKPHADCDFCGKDFIPKTSRNRFCCFDCQYEYQKREKREMRNGNNKML
jgi:predicted nucleic acid-binding Zn ribbon protein